MARLGRAYRALRGGADREPFRPVAELRRDAVAFDGGPEIRGAVCWKSLATGKGPCASLFVLDEEVLRFDCFGPGDGHYHVAVTAPGPEPRRRLYLHEATVDEQIERTVHELTRNLPAYLRYHPRAEVRRCKVDAARMEQLAAEIRERMLHLLDTVPELADLPRRSTGR